jgi:hypothetical protein
METMVMSRQEIIEAINELLEQYNVPVWSEKDFIDYTFDGTESYEYLQGLAGDIASEYQTCKAQLRGGV